MTPLDVFYTERARKDVREAKDNLEAKNRNSGSVFSTRIDQAINRISRFPVGAKEIHNGVRRVVVRQFGFLIFYRAETTRVVILACVHSREDPELWPEV